MSRESAVKPSARLRIIFTCFGFGGCRSMAARAHFDRKRRAVQAALQIPMRHAQPGRYRRRDPGNQPVMCNQCQTNDCHHGNCGRNCGGRPHATQHCTGYVTRW